MPFYTFKCPDCEDVKEVLQDMKTANPVCVKCIVTSCGLSIIEMERVYTSIGKPQFKGGGFYETDYKKKEKPK